MNNAQLNLLRKNAAAVTENGKYTLKANGSVVMFGLSKERAGEYSKYYKNATIIKEVSNGIN